MRMKKWGVGVSGANDEGECDVVKRKSTSEPRTLARTIDQHMDRAEVRHPVRDGAPPDDVFCEKDNRSTLRTEHNAIESAEDAHALEREVVLAEELA